MSYPRESAVQKGGNPIAGAVLFTCLFALAGLQSAHSQTLVYSDTFAGPSGNLDTETTAGISGTDGGSSGAQPQSAAIESTVDGSGNLDLQTPGGSGSGDTGYIRFDTIGATSTLYNWAASPAASAITAAGGVTISFDWTANDTTSDNWIYVALGADPADSFGYGYANVIWSPNTASGILLANDGNVQTFHSSSSAVDTGSFTPTSDSHIVSLTYSFSSWAAGAPVSLTATVDGNTVISGDSFVWNAAESGANYLNIGTYQETNAISNLEINTIASVPEPGACAMALLGLPGLLIWGRLRGAKRWGM